MDVERIVLDVDDRPAVAAAGRANAALAGTERTAERAVDAASRALEADAERVVRVTQRSRASIAQIVSAAERRASSAGRTELQRLELDKSRNLSRVAGEPEAIARVTAAYDRMIAAQRQADDTAVWRRRADAARSFGQALSIGVTTPMVATAVAALKFSEQFRAANVAFTQMLGSQEKARQFLKDLEQFAQQTPFEFAELVPAAQRMRALGFGAKEVIPVLRAVGDQVSALGRGQEYIDRITLALGQMKTKGKVSFEEVRQLAEAGVPAFQAIAEKIGISVPEAMKRAEKGAISAAVAVPAILERMVRETGGLMAKQNASVTGQFSNLKDQTGFLLRDIGNLLAPTALQVIRFAQSVVAGMRTVVDAFTSAPRAVQIVVGTLVGFVALAGPVAFAASTMSRALALLGAVQLGSGIASFMGTLATIPGAVANVAIAIRTGMTGALIGGEAALLLFAQAAVVVVSAFAAWKAGEWIRDILGLGAAADQAAKKMQDAANEDLKFATSKAAESLRKRGVDIRQNGQSLEVWSAQVRGAMTQLIVFDEMTKKGNQTHADTDKVLRAEKRAHDELTDARRDAVAGIGRLLENYGRLRAEIGLSIKANRDLAEATTIRLRTEAQAESRRAAADAVGRLQSELDARKQFDSQRLASSLEVDRQISELGVTNAQRRLEQEVEVLEAGRDREMRALEGFSARTVQQKIALEQRKAQIEEDSLLRIAGLRASLLEQQMQHEVAIAEAGARARGEAEEQIAARRSAIIEEFGLRGRELELRTMASIDAARETAATRSLQLVEDNTLNIFNRIKSTSDRVFGDMLRSGESFFTKLGNIFENAMLTALREVVSSQVARSLTQLLTGQRVGFDGSVSGGGSGGILGLGSSALSRIGLGSPVLAGGGGSLSGVLGPGAPGGTSGFAGPVGGGSSGGFSQFASVGAAQKASLLDFLGIGGSVQTGAGTATTFGAASLTQKLGALGKSNAALFGGGLLAFDGLRRGGALGLAETTAGGALIGFKFGGPIGALIGAGIGAAAGTVRLFIKGAEQKVIDRVQGLYGVKITREFARDPLMGIIKQQFGGNIDLGIRSPQVRDLIELYAMNFGQQGTGFAPVQRSLSLVQRGGQLFETSSYQNGTLLPSSGFGGTASAPTGDTRVVVNLDPQAVKQALAAGTIETIAENPRAIAESGAEATRRGVAPSLFVMPGFVER